MRGEMPARGEARVAGLRASKRASPPGRPCTWRTAAGRPPPRPQPALTLQAAGGRPQHPQQYLPPAEEPHGTGRAVARTTTQAERQPAYGDARRAPSRRKTE